MKLEPLFTAANNLIGNVRAYTQSGGTETACRCKTSKLLVTATALETRLQECAERQSRRGVVRSILVGVDGSVQSMWALDEAIRLADGLGARLSLIHVVADPVGFAIAPKIALDGDARCELTDTGRALVEAYSELVPQELIGDRIVCQGLAAQEVVRVAERTHTDLIVIGTHSRGRIGRFLLDSVAESIVRHAPCPVLTVAHPSAGSAPEACVRQSMVSTALLAEVN